MTTHNLGRADLAFALIAFPQKVISMGKKKKLLTKYPRWKLCYNSIELRKNKKKGQGEKEGNKA